MKHSVPILPVAALAALAACSSPQSPARTDGVVAAATSSSISLATSSGDTLTFNTAQAGRNIAGDLKAGDSVCVYYHGKYSAGMAADSLFRYDRPDSAEVRSYEGVLPAASCPGIRYTLTVRAPRHSGDGTFDLSLTYLEAEDGKDRTFRYSGRRWTQRGMPGNNDATIWQLVADGSGEKFNFLVESDSVLVLLNEQGERISSELDYTLRRTR